MSFDATRLVGENGAEEIALINRCLDYLKSIRVERVEVEGRYLRSKLAWKLAIYRQSMLYRIVALAESSALNWNQANVLGAYLSTRALLETYAVLFETENQIGEFVIAKDVSAIDVLLQRQIFATRLEDWLGKDPATKSDNVLKFIDRLDKRLIKGIRGQYDRLSERCHPNYLGHHAMFSILDTDTGVTTFTETKDLDGNEAVLIAALLPLLLVQNSIDRLDDLVDEIADLPITSDDLSLRWRDQK